MQTTRSPGAKRATPRADLEHDPGRVRARDRAGSFAWKSAPRARASTSSVRPTVTARTPITTSPGPACGVGPLAQLEHLRAPVATDDDGPHDVLLSMTGGEVYRVAPPWRSSSSPVSASMAARPAPAAVIDGDAHRIPRRGECARDAGRLGRLARADRRRGLEDRVAVDRCTLLPPVPDPPNLYMAGANYADHAARCTGSRRTTRSRGPPSGPFFFLKPDDHADRRRRAVVLGAGVSRLDWEVELAAVIGRRAHRVSEADALDHVAGYTILNDISARDAFVRSGAEPPFTYDWLGQKGWATSAPCGPWLLPARDCPDPGALGLRLWVGDERDAGLEHVPDALLARGADLAPVAACAARPRRHHLDRHVCRRRPARGRFLAPGDVMRCEIERIGVLEQPGGGGRYNDVRADQASGPRRAAGSRPRRVGALGDDRHGAFA